jgi:hypothetical protein
MIHIYGMWPRVYNIIEFTSPLNVKSRVRTPLITPHFSFIKPSRLSMIDIKVQSDLGKRCYSSTNSVVEKIPPNSSQMG